MMGRRLRPGAVELSLEVARYLLIANGAMSWHERNMSDGAITPQQASKFLAILLRLCLFAFVGVIIIGFTTGGGIKLPEIGCDEVVVGHKPSMLLLMDVGGGGAAIYEARYQISIRDVRIPVPYFITKWFTNGLRCGQP